MKIAVLTNGWVPFPTGFGSAIHVWSFVETLRRRGHELYICCYGYDPKEGKAVTSENVHLDTIRDWENKGVRIRLIPARPPDNFGGWRGRRELMRKVLAPCVGDFYPGNRYASDVSRLVREIKPDGLCAWTVDGVAATLDGLASNVARFAFLTDLEHLDRLYRRRFRPARSLKGKLYQLVDAMADRRLPGLTVSLLQDCQVVYDHAAHHCQWLREQGVTHARYLPVPVLDQAEKAWLESREKKPTQNGKLRISLIGNVSGIATLPGLYLAAAEVLPQLEKLYPLDQCEVHVIGGGRYPDQLIAALQKPYVRIRGYVENIHAEFQASDVFLVPTPIDLGFRTRISEAFSFGCCVVAHQANAAGMPEMHHELNALVASSATGLATEVARCLRDSALRNRLGNAARSTFEQALDGSLVCNQMVDSLEEMVKSRGARW